MHTARFLVLLLSAACTGPAQEGPGEDSGTRDTGSETDGCDDPCETASSASVDSALGAEAFTQSTALTRHNPLKGLMTSYLWGEPASDFPDQMEFLYLPMAELWNEKGETLEAGLEPYLVDAEGRGHHAVVRVYIDYPARESGLPDYLSEQVDCQEYEDHGGGCSPAGTS